MTRFVTLESFSSTEGTIVLWFRRDRMDRRVLSCFHPQNRLPSSVGWVRARGGMSREWVRLSNLNITKPVQFFSLSTSRPPLQRYKQREPSALSRTSGYHNNGAQWKHTYARANKKSLYNVHQHSNPTNPHARASMGACAPKNLFIMPACIN